GKYNLTFGKDALCLANAKSTVVVPTAAVTHVAILDQIPDDKKKRCLLFVVLDRQGGAVMNGKQRLEALLVQLLAGGKYCCLWGLGPLAMRSPMRRRAAHGTKPTLETDVVSITAASGEQLEGPVVAVLCQALGLCMPNFSNFIAPDPDVYRSAKGRLYLEDGVVTGWLAPLPRQLWEAGGAAPEASAAALMMLLDAARFARPGSSVSAFLAATLQPQLAPLFAAQLPPKAAKGALAKHAAAAGAAAAGTPAAGGADAAGVAVLLPGVVAALPAAVAELAVDLLFHLDFKRVKHKVGKKLPRAKNETNIDYHSKSINLPSQGVREDRSAAAVNYQNLNIKELLNQTSHHNDKSRKHSLVGLGDLFGRHPEQLRLNAAQVLGTLSERVVDGDSGVRSATRALLHDRVLPLLGPDTLRPFMPVVMAHVCGAMTHLSLDVRNDALLFLDVMMDHAPRLIVDGFLAPCLAHFCDLFSASHRGRSIRSQSLSTLTKLLTSLTTFLRRAFPDASAAASAAPAAPASAASASAPAASASAAAAAEPAPLADGGGGAGPGPSSARQQQHQQLLRSLARDMRRGPCLGSDRTRWPARSQGELLAGLDVAFRAAAAATRAGLLLRAVRGRGRRSGASGPSMSPGGVDKVKKGKKGRGSISTSEAPTSAHQVGGGPGPSGGKGVAAAAAALAAVSSDLAMSALGGAAEDGGGPLGAPSTMAAALAAAADPRASALRLVSLLMDAWLECAPAQLATAPELEAVSAMAMIVTAANTLIDRLLLPTSAAAAAPGGGGG
ncbi:Testis-expressed sequence 10 protein, partial [Tetrabaena socialis]